MHSAHYKPNDGDVPAIFQLSVRRRTERVGRNADNPQIAPNRAASIPGLKTQESKGYQPMLYTIAVILLILWLLGLVTSTTMGGFIHILLVIAIVVILLRVISGRKPL